MNLKRKVKCPRCGEEYDVLLPPFPVTDHTACRGCGAGVVLTFDGRSARMTADVGDRRRY